MIAYKATTDAKAKKRGAERRGGPFGPVNTKKFGGSPGGDGAALVGVVQRRTLQPVGGEVAEAEEGNGYIPWRHLPT